MLIYKEDAYISDSGTGRFHHISNKHCIDIYTDQYVLRREVYQFLNFPWIWLIEPLGRNVEGRGRGEL